MSMESDLAAIEAADTTLEYVGHLLGMVFLQAQSKDDVLGFWLYEREVEQGEFKIFHIYAKAKNASKVTMILLNGIKEIAQSDITIRLLPHRKQRVLVQEYMDKQEQEEE